MGVKAHMASVVTPCLGAIASVITPCPAAPASSWLECGELPDVSGQLLWFDATQEAVLPDGTVITPLDFSAFHNNGSMNGLGGTLTQPTYKTGLINGLPAFKFAAGQGFRALNPIALLNPSSYTIFCVFKGIGPVGYQAGHLYHYGDTLGNPLVHMSTSSAVIWCRRGTVGVGVRSTYNDNSPSGQWGQNIGATVIRHDYQGTHAQHALWLNGVLQAVGGPVIADGLNGDPGTLNDPAPAESFFVGCRGTFAASLTGYIGELRFYMPRLSDADALKAEGFLRTKWGL